jgi:hypothetical protein
MAYPSPVLGGLAMTPAFLGESGVGIRAIIPGMWATPHNFYNVYGANLDTWSGAVGSDIEGRAFRLHKQGYSGQAEIFETSDTWGV